MRKFLVACWIALAATASLLFGWQAALSLAHMPHMDVQCFSECIEAVSSGSFVAVPIAFFVLGVVTYWYIHGRRDVSVRVQGYAAPAREKKGILRLQRRD